MKLHRRFLGMALAAALLLTTPALAWTAHPQDLTNVEVTFDEGVDPAKRTSAPSSWAKTEVEAAIAAGLVPDLTGNPQYNAPITREQFAELAVRTVDVINGGDAFDMSEVEKIHFSDSENQAVLMAASIGVVKGTGNGNFSPKLTTNREQIACMITRAWDYLADHSTAIKAPAPAADLSGYADYAAISDWAVDGVGAMVYNGLMKGDGANLGPKDSCTVEQAILLCYRLYTTILPQ